MGQSSSSPPPEDLNEPEPVMATAEIINDFNSVYDLNLSHENVSEAFIEFMSNVKNWQHSIDTESLLLLFTKDSIQTLGREALNRFTFPLGTKHLIVQFLTRREEAWMKANQITENYKKEDNHILLRRLIDDADLNFFSLLIGMVFPLFLHSPVYLALVEGNVKRNGVELNESAEEQQDSRDSNENKDEEFNISGDTTLDEIVLVDGEADPLELLFAEIPQKEEVRALIQSSDWRGLVDRYLEQFPLSVGIYSAAGVHFNCYPLVFVNEAFTAVTGFRSQDAIGFDCSILYSHRTEEDQARVASQAFSDAQPAKVAFSNRKANGSEFLQPVHDRTGGDPPGGLHSRGGSPVRPSAHGHQPQCRGQDRPAGVGAEKHP